MRGGEKKHNAHDMLLNYVIHLAYRGLARVTYDMAEKDRIVGLIEAKE